MRQCCFQYKFCLLEADRLGCRVHPQVYMTELGDNHGIKFPSSEPAPLGDCWFFYSDVLLDADQMPEFLSSRTWLEDYPNPSYPRYLNGSTDD